MKISIPKVYPILDSSILPAVLRAAFLQTLGESLADAGLRWLEYRNKTGTEEEMLVDADILRAALPVGQVKLILDDRVDLAMADAGLRWLEYRNKTGTEEEMLVDADILRAALPVGQVKLILDDRVDL